ncbi:hypothetical protein BGZ80_005496, partial [Entomortierella chlamydospora]
MWERLSKPAQVVLRQAQLSITELSLDPANGLIIDQLSRRFDPQEYRIDLTQAPLMRFVISQDIDGRCIVIQLLHHLIGDHSTMDIMSNEINVIFEGNDNELPTPPPFRNLIFQARSGFGVEAHQAFFTKMLSDIDTPALPFGLSDVQRDGIDITESQLTLPQHLNNSLRGHAKRMGVSVASLCHLAWAMVIARTSGQQRVVFGTVLFGRMQAGSGSDRAMGLFINTLPLRVDVEDASIEDSVRKIQTDLAGLLEHEHASLAIAQRCSSIPAGTPLFSTLLNYRHNSVSSNESSDIAGIQYLEARERTNYPLDISVEDGGSSLGLTVQVVRSIDANRICGYMQQALQSLADALDTAPKMTVKDLDVLPLEERQLLLQSSISMEQDYPADKCIHQLFEDQVNQTPDAVALVFDGQTLSYSELNVRANILAHHLIQLGVEPDALVAICVDRSLAMIVGLLAVMKAGGAYVPLDPTYPSSRLKYMLTDAAPAILLADNVGRLALNDADLSSLTLLDPSYAFSGLEVNPSIPTLTSCHLAYVIYTSGSTGAPKGVMIEHQGVVNQVNTRPAVLGVDSTSRVLQFSSLSFDGSVDEIFSALCFGGSLHVLSDRTRFDRTRLWCYLEEYSITQAELTPALLQDCKDLPPLSTPLALILGGDALPPTLLQKMKDLIPNGYIVNAYGPTETTVDAVIWKCSSDFNGEVVPIGRPIANKRVYVLDADKNPVPLGAVGELYIGGVGLARGYLNRPDLTAKAFLPDPFMEESGGRMYKTGDLVRYLPDGNLMFLGRNDHQIKIRGFRIELGEIEACLAEHPVVREAAVVVVGEVTDKRLVAYVVAEPRDRLASMLRAYLTTMLPGYMIPAAFIRLDVLPLTPNGKLDRRALPAPDSAAFVSQEYEAPQGEIESSLAAIWVDLLKVERVGRHDNFFMLGGHSLLVVQMIERLRRIDLALSVRSLFDTPTLSVLAQSLSRHYVSNAAPENLITPQTMNITPEMLPLIDLTQDDINTIIENVEGGVSNIQDIYALSPLQDGILFHHIMATKGDPYLLIHGMAFNSRELLDRYLDAVQKVVDRHDILRTAVMWENLSKPAQVVLRQAQLSITELILNSSDGPISDQLNNLFNPREYRIDLTKAPLIQFAISQDVDGRWIAIELTHHLIGDHSTIDIMQNEIQVILEGRGDTLAALHPFRNLIAEVRSGPGAEAHEKFFTKMLSDIETPALPYGLADVHRDGVDITESHLSLPQHLNSRLRGHAK